MTTTKQSPAGPPTSRERILTALGHQEPDRIPRDLGGTESSGMTAFALFTLQAHLQVSSRVAVFEPYQYVAYIGEDLRARFGIDTDDAADRSVHIGVSAMNRHRHD